MRYVLSLLLVRRRVLRLEDVEHDELVRKYRCCTVLVGRRASVYPTIVPSNERTEAIQQELSKLLVAKGG